MTAFVALRAKTYAFTHLNNEDQLEDRQKEKAAKKCVLKKYLNFYLYKKALFNNETIRHTYTYTYGIDKELVNRLENEIKQKPIQPYY